MPGLLSAMEGFCVIGIVIATGYVAARMRIGGPTAQMVLNRFSFFVSSPCLMFAILSKEKIFEIFHSSIVVAFFSALLVGVVFLILNRLFFHMKAADATIGALNSLYLNSNNIGLPIATYILGNPALVAPILVMQQAVFTPIGLTVLDVTTKGKVSAKEILKQPLHQPLLIGSLLGIGIMAQVAWQVFCHIGVATALLPNTGISLPFFSYGGTSLLILLGEMGIMLSISRAGNGRREARRQREQEEMENRLRQKSTYRRRRV